MKVRLSKVFRDDNENCKGFWVFWWDKEGDAIPHQSPNYLRVDWGLGYETWHIEHLEPINDLSKETAGSSINRKNVSDSKV